MLSRALPRVAARRSTALRVQHARCFSSDLELDFETSVFDKQPYTVSSRLHLLHRADAPMHSALRAPRAPRPLAAGDPAREEGGCCRVAAHWPVAAGPAAAPPPAAAAAATERSTAAVPALMHRTSPDGCGWLLRARSSPAPPSTSSRAASTCTRSSRRPWRASRRSA